MAPGAGRQFRQPGRSAGEPPPSEALATTARLPPYKEIEMRPEAIPSDVALVNDIVIAFFVLVIVVCAVVLVRDIRRERRWLRQWEEREQ